MDRTATGYLVVSTDGPVGVACTTTTSTGLFMMPWTTCPTSYCIVHSKAFFFNVIDYGCGLPPSPPVLFQFQALISISSIQAHYSISIFQYQLQGKEG